ncbi:MAG: hypothetical protein LH480_06605 [Rubrivivax sp.]|nr:hypothetical protein [Rubrivivax sp.]
MTPTLYPAHAGAPMSDDSTASPGNERRTAVPGDSGALQRTSVQSDPAARKVFWRQRGVRIAIVFAMTAVLGTVMAFGVGREVRSQAIDQPRLLLRAPHPMGAYQPSETLPPARAEGETSQQQQQQQYQRQHEPSVQPANRAHQAPAGRNPTNVVPLQRSQRMA